jgi:hypothetical protein
MEMLLIALGALMIVMGIALAATRTASRGPLSQPHARSGPARPIDTLEPTGRGDRLSIKADLSGIGLMVLGGFLIFLGAAT